MSYMLFGIIVLLLYFAYKREEQFKEERKDYLDRIMSKDFVEYKQTESVQYEPVVLTEEEEYYREIEEQKV